jgi:hypothetical protein
MLKPTNLGEKANGRLLVFVTAVCEVPKVLEQSDLHFRKITLIMRGRFGREIREEIKQVRR